MSQIDGYRLCVCLRRVLVCLAIAIYSFARAASPAVDTAGGDTNDLWSKVRNPRPVVVGIATLEGIRNAVASNEARLNPIRLRFRTTFRTQGAPAGTEAGFRRPGRRFSHMQGEWAQKGERHYAKLSHFYSADELWQTRVYVVDETNWTSALLPGWTQSSTRHREELQWNADVGITALGLRPFEGDYPLSEILQPQWARVAGHREEIDGKLAAVVETKRRVLNPDSDFHKRMLLYPDHVVYYGRVWIDEERGVVLRIRYFAHAATALDRYAMATIVVLRHHRLSNGAWLPIEGTRTFDATDQDRIEHIKVDQDSITIETADIPDSLFTVAPLSQK